MRRDIQFLRGLAVTVVVLYHSNLGFLNHGYLGVDIFFVLSGFLITTIILKGLDNGNFSFSAFYLRRAQRLLPALYSTLLLTTLVSIFFLTSKQWMEYLLQLIGALTFTANIVLPIQTGYFESASDGKPLLHIWSLSLEEQFYFLLPISLFLLPKKVRIHFLVIAFSLSLFWCISWVLSKDQSFSFSAQLQNVPFLWRLEDSIKSDWAFYLLFTRAWELLAGSICAWIMLKNINFSIPSFIKYIALFVIFLACFKNMNSQHPSIESFFVVLCTSVILLGNDKWLPNNLFTRVSEKIGDWSYSIYLIHWPLFAFAFIGYVGDVSSLLSFALIFVSFYFGYLQFKFVEAPFRSGRFKKVFSSWRVVLGGTFLLLSLPALTGIVQFDKVNEYDYVKRINQGLAAECDGSFDNNGMIINSCLQRDAPKIAIWGDSYAMHLVPGLATLNEGLVQITKSSCAPLLGLSQLNSKYNEVWAAGCIKFNKKSFEYLKSQLSISHVVLSFNVDNYVQYSSSAYFTDSGILDAGENTLVSALKNTIIEIQNLGMTAIVFSPPPKAGFDVGECLERQQTNTVLLRENCNIPYENYSLYQSEVINFLKNVEPFVKVVWLENYLCDGVKCNVLVDETFLYRDSGHLTIDGSIKILGDIKISDL